MMIRALRAATRTAARIMTFLLAAPLALSAQNVGARAPSPQGLWAAQNSPSSVVLSWRPVPGATGYRLHCAAGGAPQRLVGRPASNATQWILQVTPAMIGVDHRCALEVDTPAGSSGPVAFNPFTPQAGGPPAASPANIAARQTGAAEITVSWADVPGATAYYIGRSAGPEGFRVLCQVCPDTAAYVDSVVAPGMTYIYTVAAVTPAGTSRRVTSAALVADPAYGQAPAAASGGGAASATSTGGSQSGAAQTGSTGTATTGAARGAGATTASGGSGRTAGTGTNAGLRNPGVSTGTGGGGVGGGTGGTGSTGGKGGTGGTTHGSTAPQPCTLEYRRADNMWAALGRADGNLGAERITLQPGQTRAFVTDWAYEKKRNDGTNFYGSHTRIASNPGNGPVAFRIRGEIDDGKPRMPSTGFVHHSNLLVTLQPGQSVDLKADLLEVSCQ